MEENLDVLDENGNLTGEQKTRQEIHHKGLWHRIVHVWIVNSKKQLLIQKRSANKDSDPGIWTISCEGHIPAGSNSRKTALSEIQEELGLEIPNDKLEFLFTISHAGKPRPGFIPKHFFDSYLIRADFDLKDIKLQKEEISDAKWLDLDEYKKTQEEKNPTFRQYPDEFSRILDIINKSL